MIQLQFLQACRNIDDFYDNTISENYAIIHAYQKDKYLDQCNARTVAYIGAMPYMPEGKRVDIYEFYPLAFDPSEDELKTIRDKSDKEEEQKLIKLIDFVKEQHAGN